jgi:ribonucleoside-diphosphate reductase alpha chain
MKWNDEQNRYETWEEACDDVLHVHYSKYGDRVKKYIDEISPFYKNKDFLVSQRALQFRNKELLKNNCRLYNCSVAYCYSPNVFKKGFFMLLSGAGFGLNLKKKYVSQLPKINKRGKETITFTIPDSIEGWCEAIHVLISSYCIHSSLYKEYYGKKIRMDYSLIREEGSFISGGFKAPGHKGLQQSLEAIEDFIEKQLGENSSIIFRSFIAYNIFMHLSNSVLSGGVRRSSMNIIIDVDDTEMVYAKTGNWRQTNPHFARSNNSVGMMKHSFTIGEFKWLLDLNQGDNDIGFVLLESEDQLLNPCYEISFDFYNQITDYNDTVIQMCNLCENNASKFKDKNGKFDVNKFYTICRISTIAGTLQAGYTDFAYLGEQTERIVKGEALLGVSITGWMDCLELFNEEILKKGAEICVETNKEVAEFLGINYAARITCTKPSGNASVVLKTPSGIHPEHSKRYFRIMQLNKENEISKWLLKNYPEMLEESSWSPTKTDYVVYVPCENSPNGKFKDDLRDIDHLAMIKLVQNSWVVNGKNASTAYNPKINHNVSNTVMIDNKEDVIKYIFENQDSFVAVSFLSRYGDKEFNQAPFTSVLDSSELLEKYGNGVLFASGLIVDGLHYFNNDLWTACKYISEGELNLNDTRDKVLLQKDWLRRAKKFAKNYFGGDVNKTIYCIKDVHLYHKWCNIKRTFKTLPDFSVLLPKPEFKNIDTLGAIACAGGSCEI